MRESLKNIGLISLDDMFTTEEQRQEAKLEKIQIVPAGEVYPYARQPYTIDRATTDLVRLMDSIESIGISEPLITRPRKDGGYEIISGHRRDYCAKMLGIKELPIIVRNYTDDEADILVVDHNITREDLLPSEKARAYKLKLDAMKRQAGRPTLESQDELKNCVQVGHNFFGKKSRELLAEQVNDSATNIQRYIRLNDLIPSLLEQVDSGILKVTPAADYISQLTEHEQMQLALVMEQNEVTPSIKQAQQLKQLSQEGKLTESVLEHIMTEEKPSERKVILHQDKLKKYFPASYTPRQMEDVIIKLLEGWHRKKTQEQSR